MPALMVLINITIYTVGDVAVMVKMQKSFFFSTLLPTQMFSFRQQSLHQDGFCCLKLLLCLMI